MIIHTITIEFTGLHFITVPDIPQTSTPLLEYKWREIFRFHSNKVLHSPSSMYVCFGDVEIIVAQHAISTPKFIKLLKVIRRFHKNENEKLFALLYFNQISSAISLFYRLSNVRYYS